MFAGKGGVGKTTCAAATALHHASLGKRTLIISTDPTPSLSHIFEMKSEEKPARILDGLYLAELGLEEVKQMWDKKFGREVYEIFSSFVSIGYEEFVDFITSILPGLSDEFMVDYIKEVSRGGEYEMIVWDTAPLGQTIGLLQTPTMIREHLKPAPRIYSRLRLGGLRKKSVLGIIEEWEKLSAKDMDFLREEVRFAMVTIPEALAVEQLEGIFGEFDNYGFKIDQLIINHVVMGADAEFLRTRAEQQKSYIQSLYGRYGSLKVVELSMFPYEIKGIERLREVEKHLFESP